MRSDRVIDRLGAEEPPGIAFAVSPVEPPLAYDDAQFDFVFAISIWSHFSAGAGLRWLDEMHRVIRPRGGLVLTTHGFQSVEHYRRYGLHHNEAELSSIRDSLESSGFAYVPSFGAEGDWGLVNPDWGMAYMTAEWLGEQVHPKWRIAVVAAGRNEGNQDVYVLERLPDCAPETRPEPADGSRHPPGQRAGELPKRLVRAFECVVRAFECVVRAFELFLHRLEVLACFTDLALRLLGSHLPRFSLMLRGRRPLFPALALALGKGRALLPGAYRPGQLVCLVDAARDSDLLESRLARAAHDDRVQLTARLERGGLPNLEFERRPFIGAELAFVENCREKKVLLEEP